MLTGSRMDPTLTAAIRPRSPLAGFAELAPIMIGVLAALFFLLLSFEGGRILAGQLGTREQSLAIMVCGVALNAAWPRRCVWIRR